MNGTTSLGTPTRQAWTTEARATVALGWPLILTNLAQTAMTATDVVMMGWLGPDALAAGALGTNLHFATMIFGLGLTTATAPMIARGLLLGVVLAFPAGQGGIGIWLGLATGLVVVAILLVAHWLRRERLGLMTAGR